LFSYFSLVTKLMLFIWEVYKSHRWNLNERLIWVPNIIYRKMLNWDVCVVSFCEPFSARSGVYIYRLWLRTRIICQMSILISCRFAAFRTKKIDSKGSRVIDFVSGFVTIIESRNFGPQSRLKVRIPIQKSTAWKLFEPIF
jgi:hypothetical protein